MPDYELLFPGRFLKSVEFKGRDVTLTIRSIALEELPERDDASTRKRGVITFGETDKQLILNRTNALCVAAMLGRDTDAWIGKRVTLFPAARGSAAYPRGEADTAIRVRGSPDIDRAVSAEIVLPRKRPFVLELVPTGKRTAVDKTRDPGEDG